MFWSENIELQNKLSNMKSDKENLIEIAKYWHEQSKEIIIDNVHLMTQYESLKDRYEKLQDDFNVLQEEYEFYMKNDKELSRYKSRVEMLEKYINKQEEIKCELSTKLCRAEGKMDKLRNFIRVTTGEDITWC